MMRVAFTSPYGHLTWTLPKEAADVLSRTSPELRVQALEAFGSNLTILCGALLKSFGDPGVVETLNLIMGEVREIIE